MGFGLDTMQGEVTTTDATQTMSLSYDFPTNSVPDNSTAIVQMRVIGFDSSQNSIAIEQTYVVKRQSGNCSIVGSATTIMNNHDLALVLASAVLNIDGSAIEVDVTGVIDTTINWGARIDILYYS